MRGPLDAEPERARPNKGVRFATGRGSVLLALGAASVILALGWARLWFLTDDAFIAFRYASNSRLGLGYVWNGPPFAPVEGYSSFLWVVLLELVWRTTGIEPPDSCNWISLGFSWLTLGLGTAMIWRLRLGARLDSHKAALTALALLGLVTNRTFLTWTSSGLETAMFGFLVTLWIYACLYMPQGTPTWIFATTACSALIYLARPDGQLFAAATILMIVLWLATHKVRPSVRLLAAMAPVLAIPIHLAWRFATYGQWLPNTYFAKFTGIWPASGIRYLLSFILEYAIWIWVLLLALVVVRQRARLRLCLQSLPACFVVLTLLGQVGYYTFVIGGDHFEYRIYSHLVLPLLASFVWLLGRAAATPKVAVLVLSGFVALSWPIPLTHWAHSHQLSTREQTLRMKVPVSPHWPVVFQWYARPFDHLQFWLIDHLVCVRHQEHKVNLTYLKSMFPTRAEGSAIGSEGFPVLAFAAVGLASWVLPNVNVIDLHGLNDPVIARLPRLTTGERQMAHERLGPEDYVAGFYPNVILLPEHGLSLTGRRRPLTAADIARHQRLWLDRVGVVGKDD